MKLLPPSYRLGALQEDYSAMRNMLYGEIPPFEIMMEAVGELEKEIHTPITKRPQTKHKFALINMNV